MDQEERRRKAADLVRLTWWEPASHLTDLPSSAMEAVVQLQELQFALMVDLYSEYFSDEQLQSQLDYYNSEMGKSILESRSHVSTEFQALWPDLAEKLNGPKLDPEALEGMLRSVKARRITLSRKKPDDGDA